MWKRNGKPQAWGTPCKFGKICEKFADFSWQLQLSVQQAQLSNEKNNYMAIATSDQYNGSLLEQPV